MRVGSILEPFGRRYDLIVTIEVLEHLKPHEAERAVANLCAHADDVLFSSTPFDFKEASHFNVQPPEYWAELFARQGFYRDLDYDASFITRWAVRFRKANLPAHRVAANYERKLWRLSQENLGARESLMEHQDALVRAEAERSAAVARKRHPRSRRARPRGADGRAPCGRGRAGGPSSARPSRHGRTTSRGSTPRSAAPADDQVRCTP